MTDHEHHHTERHQPVADTPRRPGEPLMYLGRAMNLTPLNITLDELGGRLARGATTLIVLEPGDATRYEFMVVPLDDTVKDAMHFGTRDRWYGIAGHSDGPVHGFTMVPGGRARDYHFEPVARNAWTRETLAAFDEVLTAITAR